MHQHFHLSRPGTALLEHEATLPPDPTSPSKARRLLREIVASVGHEEWLDAGELAISEVVTNATLHARTPIEIVLAVYVDRMYVEVRDRNPMLPVARDYDEQATTGRGMGLVASLALECGVHPLGEEGKVIWFCVGAPVEQNVDDLIAAWEVDAVSEAVPPTGTNIVLRDMPPTLWLSARQHHDAILRELTLFAAEHEVSADLAAADTARYTISNALLAAIDQAQSAGAAAGSSRRTLPGAGRSRLPWTPESLDLELCIDPGAGQAFLALKATLDTAERLAVAGELLIRPGLPEIVAVRDWVCEQVLAQLGGDPPAPWPGTAQGRFETEVNARVTSSDAGWGSTVATDSDKSVIAADDANRIIGVSEKLAALIGWDVQDLVGRRVVTIVPPALREAHVAGFSRHLSTGEAHILGLPLTLPVLHADGYEIECRVVIEQSSAAPGHSVYLAWIDPVDEP